MFWKRRHHKIADLIKAIGRFPKLTEVTVKGDKPEEAKPDSLIALICKVQTLDELKEIQTKYRDSIGIVHGLAIICQEFDIKLKDLQERVSVLESIKEVSKDDTKTD